MFQRNPHLFEGPVELDEAYFRGREKNKHASKKLHAGRGDVGKTVVAGARDHATGEISAAVVSGTSRQELEPFADERVAPDADIYTDDHGACQRRPNRYTVRDSMGEDVAD